jgi:hypothetical protein
MIHPRAFAIPKNPPAKNAHTAKVLMVVVVILIHGTAAQAHA